MNCRCKQRQNNRCLFFIEPDKVDSEKKKMLDIWIIFAMN